METPVNAPFGEKIKLEFLKLREMTFKKKCEYIWDYYKLFIIGVVIVLILIGSTIYTRVINPPPETILSITFNGGLITAEQLDDMTAALEEKLIAEDEHKTISVIQALIDPSDPNVAVMNDTRTMAMVVAGHIDLFILSRAVMETYSNNGFIQPVDLWLEEIKTLNPIVYQDVLENIVRVTYTISDGVLTEDIMGINVRYSPLFEKLGLFGQDLFFCFPVNSGNLYAVKALITFFE